MQTYAVQVFICALLKWTNVNYGNCVDCGMRIDYTNGNRKGNAQTWRILNGNEIISFAISLSQF